MTARPTESRNPKSMTLDKLRAIDIVQLMNDEEQAVIAALDASVEAVAACAERVADAYRSGGRIVCLGAGTSGRLAVMEAAELPPTFGVAEDRFIAFIASGPSGGPAAITRREDDMHKSVDALAGVNIGQGDVVIGLAASGSTPFVLAGLRFARTEGAWTCGIANNPGTPLLSAGDLGILLDTGPEVVTGSTRLKAGTAQKLVLNRISTTAMVLCGKVISNLMVEVQPSNDKLRARCIRITRELTNTDSGEAEALLESNGWSIRAAVGAHLPNG